MEVILTQENSEEFSPLNLSIRGLDSSESVGMAWWVEFDD